MGHKFQFQYIIFVVYINLDRFLYHLSSFKQNET